MKDVSRCTRSIAATIRPYEQWHLWPSFRIADANGAREDGDTLVNIFRGNAGFELKRAEEAKDSDFHSVCRGATKAVGQH